MTPSVLDNFESLLDATDDQATWDALTAQLEDAVRQNARFVTLTAQGETLCIAGVEARSCFYGYVVSGEFSNQVLMTFPKKEWREIQ